MHGKAFILSILAAKLHDQCNNYSMPDRAFWRSRGRDGSCRRTPNPSPRGSDRVAGPKACCATS